MDIQNDLAARLIALIADHEQLLESVRKEQTELVGMDSTLPAQASTIYLR